MTLRRDQDKPLRCVPSLTASWLAAYRSVPTPVVANTGPSISVTAGPGERYCMVLHVGPSPALMTEMRACTHMSVSIAEPQTSPSPAVPTRGCSTAFELPRPILSFSRGIGPTLRGVAVAHGEVGPRLKDWHEDGRPDADLLRVDVPPVDVWRTARHVPLHTPTLAPSRGAGSQQQAAAAATAAAE